MSALTLTGVQPHSVTSEEPLHTGGVEIRRRSLTGTEVSATPKFWSSPNTDQIDERMWSSARPAITSSIVTQQQAATDDTEHKRKKSISLSVVTENSAGSAIASPTKGTSDQSPPLILAGISLQSPVTPDTGDYRGSLHDQSVSFGTRMIRHYSDIDFAKSPPPLSREASLEALQREAESAVGKEDPETVENLRTCGPAVCGHACDYTLSRSEQVALAVSLVCGVAIIVLALYAGITQKLPFGL